MTHPSHPRTPSGDAPTGREAAAVTRVALARHLAQAFTEPATDGSR
ncbi:hypothetical protein [Streptomyces sp. XD-27]|nr:hypothetical protein [Streptomyces sp. XD-27]WKX68648.1 hypothetical protein Q3Y56_00625 [Streptomyces sp. XD-27]